jgi:hypothetical protein
VLVAPRTPMVLWAVFAGDDNTTRYLTLYMYPTCMVKVINPTVPGSQTDSSEAENCSGLN